MAVLDASFSIEQSFDGWADVQVAATGHIDQSFAVTANPRPFEALGVPIWKHKDDEDPPALVEKE